MNEFMETKEAEPIETELKEAEFDWFPEETDAEQKASGYSKITDLGEVAEAIGLKEPEEVTDIFIIEGDGAKEGLNFEEGLAGGMNAVFSSVYDKLCGGKMEINSGRPMDMIEQLNEKCEVLQTSIYKKACDEIIARIETCLEENGCVIAIVDNEKWNALVEQENALSEKRELMVKGFMDNGLRTLEITDYLEDRLIVSYFENGQENSFELPTSEFSELRGILLEVLK